MRFWDSSAIVPLVAEEAASQACRRLLRRDARIVVWATSITECLSALCRTHRTGGSSDRSFESSVSRLRKLASRWHEVDALTLVRDQAARLLRVHPLRAADALQLGAALIAADLDPRRMPFVCLDGPLAEAAGREGFEVLRPPG